MFFSFYSASYGGAGVKHIRDMSDLHLFRSSRVTVEVSGQLRLACLAVKPQYVVGEG